MRAMILAAGLGERMMPLTADLPKPLLTVAGKPLIQYHIENLVSSGFEEIVINHSHLGHEIEDFVGDGHRFGARIQYSAEPDPLETAGGIINALPLLGNEAFVVVNGDIWTDYPFHQLATLGMENYLGHLIMVANNEHHPEGDFYLMSNGLLQDITELDRPRYTFSGISVFRQEFFDGFTGGRIALKPLLVAAMERGKVGGEYYAGRWVDVGSPQKLKELDEALRAG